MDHEECKNKYDRSLEINNQLLKLFREDLAASGLKEKTILRHLSNIDFYINTFLLQCNAVPMEQGISFIDDYLGDFFIRKCMWSTPGNIKTNAASIKKFYKCMLGHGKIPADDYACLCDTIRENMNDWQFRCELYNDPEEPSPFFLF